MIEFRTCQGDWPGVAAHSRRACHDVATLEVAGAWLCLAHATSNIDEILTTFGQHEEDCWTEPVKRAKAELRAIRTALRSPSPSSGVDVEALRVLTRWVGNHNVDELTEDVEEAWSACDDWLKALSPAATTPDARHAGKEATDG